ncbi:MAG: hypothetical protein ACLP5H_30445 [Desulfomonilaceae bacterium]
MAIGDVRESSDIDLLVGMEPVRSLLELGELIADLLDSERKNSRGGSSFIKNSESASVQFSKGTDLILIRQADKRRTRKTASIFGPTCNR